MQNIKSKRFIKLVAILCLLPICLICFFGCNQTEESPIVNYEYKLFLGEYSYDLEEKTVFANVFMKGKEDAIINDVNAINFYYAKENLNPWFYQINKKFQVPSNELYRVIKGKIDADGGMTVEGVEYENLKVVFFYDTIYKSISSNAKVQELNGIYYHSLVLDENKSEMMDIKQKIQNSTMWYMTLTIIALAVVVIGVMIYFVMRGKNVRKTKQEQ